MVTRLQETKVDETVSEAHMRRYADDFIVPPQQRIIENSPRSSTVVEVWD